MGFLAKSIFKTFYTAKIHAVIVGGSGALGQSYMRSIQLLTPKAIITTIDFAPALSVKIDEPYVRYPVVERPPRKSTGNENADKTLEEKPPAKRIPNLELKRELIHNHILLPKTASSSLGSFALENIVPQLDALDALHGPPDVIINCSGSWSGAPFPSIVGVPDAGSSLSSYLDDFSKMHAPNFESTALTTAIAFRYLRPTALSAPALDHSQLHHGVSPTIPWVLYTGAAASTPSSVASGVGAGMAGYVCAKAASRHLAAVAAPALFAERGGACSAIVHPGTLDTLANRRAMPDADRSEWSDLNSITKTAIEIVIRSNTVAAVKRYGAQEEAEALRKSKVGDTPDGKLFEYNCGKNKTSGVTYLKRRAL